MLGLLLFSSNSCFSQSNPQNQLVEKVDNTTLKLNYTSGVRSIFEDSKGNFWFGSDDEGVCLLESNSNDSGRQSFTYFTVKDGLNDNQIRSIQEDDKGNIWFGTSKGVCSYDGEKIINHTEENIISTYELSPNVWAKTDHDLAVTLETMVLQQKQLSISLEDFLSMILATFILLTVVIMLFEK